MKAYLKNISPENLNFDTIVRIAFDLGCNYKEPEKAANRYILDGDIDKISEEQRKINEEYRIEYSFFIREVIDWMFENGYMEGKDG